MSGNIILCVSVYVRLKSTFTGWFGLNIYRVIRPVETNHTACLAVRPNDRNIIPGVFCIKQLKPGVAKTVAKRGGSTSKFYLLLNFQYLCSQTKMYDTQDYEKNKRIYKIRYMWRILLDFITPRN